MLTVKFLDSGREPQNQPNPNYPSGVTVDLSGGRPFCATAIPYPAPRCGVMMVTCSECGYKVGVTVAGRIDDPHTVKLPCKLKVQ
jgi:hypothetical protein